MDTGVGGIPSVALKIPSHRLLVATIVTATESLESVQTRRIIDPEMYRIIVFSIHYRRSTRGVEISVWRMEAYERLPMTLTR